MRASQSCLMCIPRYCSALLRATIEYLAESDFIREVRVQRERLKFKMSST